MKHLFYIVLSFLVFTACEDEKDTLPYPMNELDGTFWINGKTELYYYDEKDELIEHIEPITPEGQDLFFKGNAVLAVGFLGCDEYLYSCSWKERKLTIGKIPYHLVDYNDSYLVVELKYLESSPRVPGSSSYKHRKWYRRGTPKYSWEDYIKKYYDEYYKHY